jgi:hypothetical protein
VMMSASLPPKAGMRHCKEQCLLWAIRRHTNRPVSAGLDTFVAAPGVKARNEVI